MRYLLIASWMLFGSVTSAMAQVSIGIGVNLPGVSIGWRTAESWGTS